MNWKKTSNANRQKIKSNESLCSSESDEVQWNNTTTMKTKEYEIKWRIIKLWYPFFPFPSMNMLNISVRMHFKKDSPKIHISIRNIQFSSRGLFSFLCQTINTNTYTGQMKLSLENWVMRLLEFWGVKPDYTDNMQPYTKLSICMCACVCGWLRDTPHRTQPNSPNDNNNNKINWKLHHPYEGIVLIDVNNDSMRKRKTP